MASTLATPVAQAISLLFDGNLGKLLNYGYRPGYGVLGAVVAEWTPASLFSAGEVGVWFDPSAQADYFTSRADSYGLLPGTAGNYFSTPDSVANSITGDIDIRVKVALDDWTPAAKQALVSKWGSSSTKAYQLWLLTDGSLVLYTSADGSNTVGPFTSTVAVSAANGTALYVRSTMDVDNGSSGKTVAFFTSADGVTWSQLGGQVTTAGTTSIRDSTSIVEIGATLTGGLNLLAGKIYRAQIYNVIDGTTPVVDFNPNDVGSNIAPPTWTSSTTGEVWARNGTASISGTYSGTPVLFTDAAGTTPVTALEQQVGLMLDKSGNGYHASQPTAASKATLSARYNLLTQTENFADAAWQKAQSTVTANQTISPDGTLTADLLQNTGSASYVNTQNLALAAGSYTQSISVKKGNTDYVLFYCSDVGANYSIVWINVTTGELGTIANAGTFTGATVSRVAQDNGFYRITLTFTKPVTVATNTVTIAACTGDNSFTRASGQNCYIWHPSLVPADQASLPYQRVGAAVSGTTNPAVTGVADYDSDPTKFPWYLKTDGIDDWMSTPSIPFVTDKMTVVAGVRKLSDATSYPIVCELGAVSNTTPNTFSVVFANAELLVAWQTHGSATLVSPNAPYTSPRTSVIGGIASIGTDVAILRVNGAQVASATTDQGGVDPYGTYPLYLFRRGGTVFPFNGHFYGLIVRGAETTAEDIAFTETFMASKTGVTL